MKEASVSATLNSGNVQTVDTASAPDHPSKPNIPLNLGLAFFVSLTLGTGAAFLLDRMDNSISSPEVADAVSGWPSLGMIPFSQSKHKLAAEEGNPTAGRRDQHR